MSLQHLSEQEQIRRNSLEEIRALGIEPYPAEGYPVNITASKIKTEFRDDSTAFGEVWLAGRIMCRGSWEAHLLLNCRMPREEYKFTFSGIRYAPVKIRPFTIRYLKNSSILVISSAFMVMFSGRRWAKSRSMSRVSGFLASRSDRSRL